MSSVVEVETRKPVVTSVTLKLGSGEAQDLLVYIETYHKKYNYMSDLAANPTFRALTDALAGKADNVKVV